MSRLLEPAAARAATRRSVGVSWLAFAAQDFAGMGSRGQQLLAGPLDERGGTAEMGDPLTRLETEARV